PFSSGRRRRPARRRSHSTAARALLRPRPREAGRTRPGSLRAALSSGRATVLQRPRLAAGGVLARRTRARPRGRDRGARQPVPGAADPGDPGARRAAVTGPDRPVLTPGPPLPSGEGERRGRADNPRTRRR